MEEQSYFRVSSLLGFCTNVTLLVTGSFQTCLMPVVKWSIACRSILSPQVTASLTRFSLKSSTGLSFPFCHTPKRRTGTHWPPTIDHIWSGSNGPSSHPFSSASFRWSWLQANFDFSQESWSQTISRKLERFASVWGDSWGSSSRATCELRSSHVVTHKMLTKWSQTFWTQKTFGRKGWLVIAEVKSAAFPKHAPENQHFDSPKDMKV